MNATWAGPTAKAASAPTNRPATACIGSISKTFTAVLTLKAVQEKRLSLDQNIAEFFPEIKNAANISVRDLLQHRSGIYDFTASPDYLSWHTKPHSRAEMLALIASGGSDFTPGSRMEYSNSNYVLLSYLLEKTYGKPYAKILNEQIIRPLGLKNTYLGGTIDLKRHECNSYSFARGWQLEKQTDPSVALGAGAVVSTPADLDRFIASLFDGRLLKPDSLKQMCAMQDGYGIGLFEIPFFEKKGYGHTGSIDGFSALLVYFPDERLALAITSNGSDYNRNSIAIAALSWAYGKPFEVPRFKTYQPAADELAKFTGVYANSQLPFSLTFTAVANLLSVQATGQPSLDLEATAPGEFRNERQDLSISFEPDGKRLKLHQGNYNLIFERQ